MALLDPDLEQFARKRRPPDVLIVDSSARIVARSFGTGTDTAAERIPQLLARHMSANGREASSTLEWLDATTALRIVGLAGSYGEYYAITLERTERRDGVEAMAEEFHLTRREREVLRLILTGATSTKISAQLSIAPTTAMDHVKNILRKTGTNKRTELFSRVMT